MSKRRNHDAGFKVRVALEAVKGERRVLELVAEYGVHPTMIQDWKKALLEGAADIFEHGGRKKAEVVEETVHELHAKIGVLAVANDLLARESLRLDSVKEGFGDLQVGLWVASVKAAHRAGHQCDGRDTGHGHGNHLAIQLIQLFAGASQRALGDNRAPDKGIAHGSQAHVLLVALEERNPQFGSISRMLQVRVGSRCRGYGQWRAGCRTRF